MNSAQLTRDVNNDTLYRIRVRTELNGVASKWGPHLFAYTTAAALNVPVANTPFYGHRSNNDYSYRMCTNQFPFEIDVDAWADDIEAGIEKWEETVEWEISVGGADRNIITVNRESSGLCIPFVDTIFNADRAELRFTGRAVLIARCGAFRGWTLGCAPLSEPLLTLASRLLTGASEIPNDVDILLDINYDDWLGTVTDENDSSTCSYLHVFVMHEAGHALGVRLDHAKMHDSVMRSTVPRRYCKPQPYDVAGFMALYQSIDLE